jgi:predicted RNase H-like HicB family nuclease
MTIDVNVRIWREGKRFIAHALPLDVSSAGDSAESARLALQEAIELFISTARDNGTLNDVLEECGYVLQNGRWVAPQIVAQQQESLPV